jgi:hypothetical protein
MRSQSEKKYAAWIGGTSGGGTDERKQAIGPRPFMVERGHDVSAVMDEWSFEYAKVRRFYDKMEFRGMRYGVLQRAARYRRRWNVRVSARATHVAKGNVAVATVQDRRDVLHRSPSVPAEREPPTN